MSANEPEAWRAPLTPPRRQPWCPLVRPTPLVPISGWCLHRAPLAYYTHWARIGKDTLCHGGDACPHCLAGRPKVWSAIVHVAMRPTCRPALFRITWGAAQYADPRYFAAQPLDWLHCLLTITVRGPKKNSPQALMIEEASGTERPYPAPIDLAQKLRLIYSS